MVNEDQEIARVKVGVPGVASAEVPVRRSAFGWIGRIFACRGVADAVAVASARAHVHVPADDEGTIEFYLTIANMGTAPLQVESITPSRVAANGNDLAILAPVSRPPQKPIGPLSTGEVGIRIPIGVQAIRLILRCVQRAQNSYSSPRIEVMVSGSLAGCFGERQVRTDFTIAAYSPELNIVCPSAKDA